MKGKNEKFTKNSGNRNYHTGKGNGKSSGKSDKNARYDTETREEFKGKGRHVNGNNDVAWYSADPQLLRDSASLAYSWPIGSNVDFNTKASQFSGTYYSAVPGVMAIHTDLIPGYSSNRSSALNLAATNLYSYVRYVNSGSKNYDSPDLMMYILAMDNIYAMFAYAARAYGVARVYSSVNRYYPLAALEAMGIKPDSLINNLANFRYKLNALAVKIGSMCVPGSMAYIARHMWMYSGIYTDTTYATAKCQTYMYVPNGFFRYRYDLYDTGTALEYVPIWDIESDPANNKQDAMDFLDLMDDFISRIVKNEDMNIMSGDILKAFGADGVVKLPQIAEDYSIIPEYNPEVLSQIENAVMLGRKIEKETEIPAGEGEVISVKTTDIAQSPELGIIYMPSFATTSPCSTDRFMLNMHTEFPTPEETMVASRLTNVATTTFYDPDQGHWESRYEHLGADYTTHCVIYTYVGTGTQRILVPFDINGRPYITTYESFTDGDDVINLINKYGVISQFDWHPRVVPVQAPEGPAGEAESYYRLAPFGDVNSYALVDEIILRKMHETALLSMFRVPLMGAWSKKTT